MVIYCITISLLQYCERLYSGPRFNTASVYWGLGIHKCAALKVLLHFEVLTFSRPFQNIGSVSYIFDLISDIDLLVCFRSFSCMTQGLPSVNCETEALILASRLLWCTEEFIIHSMTARCTDPVTAKQPHIFLLECCWIFAKLGAGLKAKQRHFDLICL